MAATLYAANEGYFDDIEVKDVIPFEKAMQAHLQSNFKKFVNGINKTPKLTDKVKDDLKAALDDFKANGSW